MALSTRHRASIYTTLSPIVGEEAINAMLAEFPASDHDRLVTEGFLRAELAELRTEMTAGFADLRGEMTSGQAELRTEMTAGFADVTAGLSDVRREVTALRGELLAEIERSANKVLLGMGGTLIAGMGLAAAIARSLG